MRVRNDFNTGKEWEKEQDHSKETNFIRRLHTELYGYFSVNETLIRKM